MNRIAAYTMIAAAAAVTGLAGTAGAGTGDDLMRRLDAQAATTGERIVVQMTRTSPGGATREATFVMSTRSPVEEPARSTIVFTSPADVAGTAVLSVEEEGGRRSQWVYLPEVGMTRKLANTDRTEPFAGTDFTLEDLRIRSDFVNRRYELVGTAEVEGQTCSVVEDTAANDREARFSGYSRVLLYVEEGRLLVWKVEFYDKAGQLQKILTAHDLERDGDTWRFNTATMTHLLDGTTTTFQGTERQSDLDLPLSSFSPAALGD